MRMFGMQLLACIGRNHPFSLDRERDCPLDGIDSISFEVILDVNVDSFAAVLATCHLFVNLT
jgi:hypothetical protein